MMNIRGKGGSEEYLQEIKLAFSSSAPLIASKIEQENNGHYGIFGTMLS